MSSSDLLAVGKDHAARSKKLPWYQASLGNKLSPEARQLFEQYSKIPAQEVEAHVYISVSSFNIRLLHDTVLKCTYPSETHFPSSNCFHPLISSHADLDVSLFFLSSVIHILKNNDYYYFSLALLF